MERHVVCDTPEISVSSSQMVMESGGRFGYEFHNIESSCEETSCDVDPVVALKLIEKGRATGNRAALWTRAVMQSKFYKWGQFIDRYAGRILVACVVILCVGCIGLPNVVLESRLEKLWIEEGDRVDREQGYINRIHGENTGANPQILLQTPDNFTSSLLTPDALLLHLKAALVATEIEVEAYGATWTMKDLCHKASLSNFDERIPTLTEALDHLYPCHIISPLDCFWEGAKLLGPQNGVVLPGYPGRVSWTNLHPQKLIAGLRHAEGYGKLEVEPLAEMFKKAGITTGYIEKPCLNPHDPACPDTAPNKKSKQPPNVAEVLSGGCSSVSTKYMHWHEELLMGNIKRNRTQNIIHISALQSTFFMAGSKALYDYHKERTSNDEWTEEAAASVIDQWQTMFAAAVARVVRKGAEKNSFTVYADNTLAPIFAAYARISVVRILIAAAVLVGYMFMSVRQWSDPVQSFSGLGVAATLLSGLVVTAGLGLAAVIGIPFNALSTQIVPFLAMAVNAHLIVQTIRLMVKTSEDEEPLIEEELCAESMKKSGLSNLMSTFCLSAAFFAAYFVPVPALRSFSLQMGIITGLSSVFLVIMLPALIALDQRRRKAKRWDILCCFGLRSSPKTANARYSRPGQIVLNSCSSRNGRRYCSPNCNMIKGHKIVGGRPCHCQKILLSGYRGTVPQMGPLELRMVESGMMPIRNVSANVDLTGSTSSIFRIDPPACCNFFQSSCASVKLSQRLTSFYVRVITSSCAKFLIAALFIVMLGCSAWGIHRIEDGLDLTEFIPKGTSQHRYQEVSSKNFGLYNMFAITRNLDYPNNQELLREYQQAFGRVDHVIRNDDGRLPPFWLDAFRDWLQDLDAAFESDLNKGCFTEEGWRGNASDDGILAFKLRAQTGKEKLTNPAQVFYTRLVDRQGIINPKAFYNYLSAWTANDMLVYSTLQTMLHPEPRQFLHDPHIFDLDVPRSLPLDFAQYHFSVHQLNSTTEILKVIKHVRSICDGFELHGLPNFPTGVLFTYWEQYITLRFYLVLALLILLVGYFVLISIIMMNPWSAAVVVLMTAVLLVEVSGLVGWFQIKLNAILAVILVFACGIGVLYTFRICAAFVAGTGCKHRRIRYTYSQELAPLLNGMVACLLGIAVLAFSNFDFVFRYFFILLAGLVVLAGLNSLLFLPVLLSFLGPVGDFVSLVEEEDIPALTPEPPSRPSSTNRDSKSRKSARLAASTVSLSTISEEDSMSCHQIFVEPQLFLETTTTTFPGARTSVSSFEPRNNPDGNAPSVKTTVSASARMKVEIHRMRPANVVAPSYEKMELEACRPEKSSS